MKFNDKKIYWLIFSIFLFISIFLILKVKIENSFTTDEIFTILSSYSIVGEGVFDFQIETPPFGKILIGFFLKNLNLEPIKSPPIERLKEPESYINFISENKVSSEKISFYSSIPFLIIFLLFSIFMAFWAYEVGEFWGGLAGIFSILFSPFYLGHTPIAQSDFLISVLFAFSFYFFYKSLKENKYFIPFSFFLGIALSSKFSGIFIIPLTLVLLLLFYLKEKKFQFLKLIFYLISVAVSFLILFSFYFYSTRNLDVKKEKEFISFVLKKYPDTEKLVKKIQKISEKSKELSHIIVGISYLNLLNKYQIGISYLFGKKSLNGFWYYFPIVFLIKNPLSYIFLLLICLFYKKLDFFSLNLLLPIILYFFIVMGSTYNYGIRHLSPIFPLISIFLAHRFKQINLKKIFAIAFCFFIFFEVLLNYPNYISYFNFLFNINPEKYLIDSNLDWGQDWKRVAKFASKNNIKDVVLVYAGTFPYEKLFERAEKFNSQSQLSENFCYAVSIHTKMTAIEYYNILKNYDEARALKELFKFLDSGNFHKIKIEKSIEFYIPKCYNKL